MGAVAEAVGQAVSDAVESVGDAVENIGREVGQAAETVGREVGKVAEVVGQTISENPATAIAIVAVAVAAPYALPAATAALGTTLGTVAVGAASGAIVGGMSTFDTGGNVLEAIAKGGLVGGVTAGLAPWLTGGLETLGVPASIASTVGSGLAGAAGGAGMAALSGGDVGLSALSGGLGSAVGAGTQIGTGSKLIGTLAGTTTAGLVGGLSGREAAGKAILAGLQGVIASTISQQFQPKLEATQQKYSAMEQSTRARYDSARAEYDNAYAEAQNLQADTENTRQRLLAIQNLTNPTDAEVAEFDNLYAKFQNQQNQIADTNNRLSTLAANVNNIRNEYASISPAYDNEVDAIQTEAKTQYAALEKQAGLLPGELAKEDPLTAALAEQFIAAQEGKLPTGLAQYASSRGTTDVPVSDYETVEPVYVDVTASRSTGALIDDSFNPGNQISLSDTLLRELTLATILDSAIKSGNATQQQLASQAIAQNKQDIVTLWNKSIASAAPGQYAAYIGGVEGGGAGIGSAPKQLGYVLNLGIPFTPIAYVYNSNNPNDVTLLDESGKTYSIVTVDGRQMLQDNSTKVYLKQFTTEQVDNLRKEQQEYVKTAQQKETQPKDIETTPKQATQNAGGGGESGFAGEEKPKGSNAFEDILRLEYQISQERDRPISIVGPSGSERLSDTGQYLGATAPVSSGQPLAKGIDTGGSLAGDIFTQGFGTTEFGTGTGKTGVGEESGKGKGTGGGKGTGEGTGEGSGTGEGTGGLSSLYVSGVGRGASGTGIGTGAGGVLYPSVGTAALAQALNIVPNLGGGGGDVDPSRSLNKKQPVWNVESLKLKDALGA